MQHEMVETFRQLVDSHPEFADWTLVCAGGLDSSRQDCIDYFDAVSSAAEGANVDLRPNVPRDELDALFGKAALYWHATGYGKDVSRTPYEFEHFGISTVEAMSAGCVPVVIGDGGQPEIVYDPAFGSTFSDRADWIETSAMWMKRFMQEPAAFEAASRAAAKAAERFQASHFKERMDVILADVESADAALYRSHLASDFTGKTYWRLPDSPDTL
jgi:glycosyltransferase involved in cell wall biosynthesis